MAYLVLALLFSGIPFPAYAILNTMPSRIEGTVSPAMTGQQPAACERACSLSAAGNCKPGDVTGNPNGDPNCAASRIGVMSYTQLSVFGNAGGCTDNADNNQCASGSCQTWQGKPVYGIAHRTFPFGTRVEVCNVQNDVCQIATVVERGPASRVTNVTIDARAELGLALMMKCRDKVPATYRVLSVPGVAQTAEPSGPADEALKKLLAAGHITGNLGTGAGNPSGYRMVDTPYGPGYLGNPTSQPWWTQQGQSPYASASPMPLQGGTQTGSQPQPTNSPFASLSGSGSARTDLEAALRGNTGSSTPATIVPGAPSVGQLLAQSATVSRSGMISLSWTTLNMRAEPPCTVRAGERIIASKNAGALSIAAGDFPTGTNRFELRCTRPDGTLFVDTQEIAIE